MEKLTRTEEIIYHAIVAAVSKNVWVDDDILPIVRRAAAEIERPVSVYKPSELKEALEGIGARR